MRTSRAEQAQPAGTPRLSDLPDRQVADYLQDLLTGAQAMAQAKDFDRLADLIAAAAREAAFLCGEQR